MRIYQRLHQLRRQHEIAIRAHRRKRAHEILVRLNDETIALLRAETAPETVDRQMIDDDLFATSLEHHGVRS